MNHDDKPSQLPSESDWNRAGWDMSDLERYGSRGRAQGAGSGARGRTIRNAQAQPTHWLTYVTLLSGLLVLTGGFNMAYGVLMLFMDGPYELLGGLQLLGEILFSAFITWAFYGVALHQLRARGRIIPFIMLKIGGVILGGLCSVILLFFAPAFGAIMLALCLLSGAFLGSYLYALQRLDVAAHFTS